LEATLFATMIGGPTALRPGCEDEGNYGFVAYDIFGFLYRPLDNALAQTDMIFVRENGPFRATHIFATPEQRKNDGVEGGFAAGGCGAGKWQSAVES